MISIDKDVRVSYREADITGAPNNKNNLLFLDRLDKTSRQQPFCEYVATLSRLGELADRSTNPGVFDFFETMKLQSFSPGGFWYCAVNAGAASGAALTTDYTDEWDTFKAAFKDADHPEILLPLGFKVDITMDETTTSHTYALPGLKLLDLRDYDGLVDLLKQQNSDKIAVSFNAEAGKITFTTLDPAVGPGANISYLLTAGGATVDDAGWLVTAQTATYGWEEFTGNIGENKCTFKVMKQDGTTELCTYTNVRVGEIDGWTDFASALTGLNPDKVKVSYGNGKLLFVTAGLGADDGDIGYLKDTGTGGDAAVATLLKGTQETGAFCRPGAATAVTVAAQDKLKGTQATGAVKTDGQPDIHDSEVLMKAFSDLAAGKVSPNAVALSRNINYDAGNVIDTDITLNMIKGYHLYFSNRSGQTTNVLVIQSNNPKAKLNSASVNARNVILNYHKKPGQFLDGAIAACVCGIPWESEDVFRNFKGLKLAGVDADPDIDDAMEDELTALRYNFYGRMMNGVDMYRTGLTCSDGDVGFADTTVGINALAVDLTGETVRAVKNGKLRLNESGIALLYDIIATVCEKYVTNGFLAPGSYTKIVDGKEKTITISPYTILISRKFTNVLIDSRTFPDTRVLLASSRFMNTITVNLADAYKALDS
jgi:hypothetical protein